MTCNVGPVDRTARLMLAVGLAAVAYTGPYTWLALVAIVPLLTSLSGYCPVYSAVGVDTSRRSADA